MANASPTPSDSGWEIGFSSRPRRSCLTKPAQCGRVWLEMSGSGVPLATEENPGVLEFSQKWFGFQGGGGCGWPGSLPARTRPPASDRRLEVCTRASPSHTRRMSGRACCPGLGTAGAEAVRVVPEECWGL